MKGAGNVSFASGKNISLAGWEERSGDVKEKEEVKRELKQRTRKASWRKVQGKQRDAARERCRSTAQKAKSAEQEQGALFTSYVSMESRFWSLPHKATHSAKRQVLAALFPVNNSSIICS